MTGSIFSEADRNQLQELGISEEQVLEQREIFRKPLFNVQLVRNCTVGDGIVKIEQKHADRYLEIHRQAAEAGRFLKFVPASGAATRMFKFLFQVMQAEQEPTREEIDRAAQEGDATCIQFKQFVDNLPGFAFWEDLKEIMARDGLDAERSLEQGKFREVLSYVLGEPGLRYGSMAKGLLQFHRYPTGSRTAFEEHLIEASQYVRDAAGICRLHFTISPEQQENFERLLGKVQSSYERQFNVRFKVEFSFQKPSTDTIAVDLNNTPLRDDNGRLVFRPGGHGALLENLSELKEYLVYIKNIDNVVPDCLKEATCFWKRVLGGVLVELQQSIHAHLKRLKDDAGEEVQKDAERFVKNDLRIDFPAEYAEWPSSKRYHFLFSKLNRPIRVCGVVRNVGEPGGAPFWVKEKDGTCSIQIVEKAQVNFDTAQQESVWNSSTHFNPVDLVCSMLDYQGRPFDLRRHTNPEAVFISHKSSGGRELKALELPGLWNGAMADWITLCVEVPIITFNPVKTINDLLRPEHQQS